MEGSGDVYHRSPSMAGSGPWLQKPLHVALSESVRSANVTPHVTPNINNRKKKVMKKSSSSGGLLSHSKVSSYHSMEEEVTNPQNSGVVGVMDDAAHHGGLERHLTLFDLVSIGVGGTVGSGIFVLCGFIAHNYAGPATCLSWAIAGVAAVLSGLCYGELACHMPSAGSSYVYVYVSMGELPAMMIGACLTLEYTVAASAVARSWGDKFIEYFTSELQWKVQDHPFLLAGHADSQSSFNLMAALIAMLAVFLLLNGVKESKRVTNFFTIAKVGVISFMALMGFFYMKPSNLRPFTPFGLSGVARGATSSFFGYLGFDEICCIAGEAIHPQYTMPRAILYTLAIVTIIYCVAALSLTGMQPFTDISDTSGFPVALHSNGSHWAAQIGALGEVFTLPIVVLITIMAQPRLQYAMAQDGLLPSIFAQVDETGNLWHGTFIAGAIMTAIAAFVPFTHLNDMISAAVLVAFSMTDSSLLILRHESPSSQPTLVEQLVFTLNVSAFVCGLSWTHFYTSSSLGQYATIGSAILFGVATLGLYLRCPKAQVFGGKNRSFHHPSTNTKHQDYFETPFLPFIPSFGIFINWYLISQLQLTGICLLLVYLGLSILYYFSYGAHYSVGNNGGWDEDEHPHDDNTYHEDDNNDTPPPPPPPYQHKLLMGRSLSLPRVSAPSSSGSSHIMT